MKTAIIRTATLALCLVLAAGCGKKPSSEWAFIKNPETVAQLKSFVAEKEAQVNASTNATSAEMKAFFAAAQKGDWQTVNNKFWDIRNHAEKLEQLQGIEWEAIVEIWGGLDAFAEGDEKYSTIYASEIINSIPPGSIYFGATDPGRFLITAMQKNQVGGNPFFTLSQNPLTDSAYLGYLRSMYGSKIYIPTAEDSRKCFDDYFRDYQERRAKNRLLPGESITSGPDGKMQINSQMSAIQIYGSLAKVIFDQNSNREFYVEESFPLDWMYPYLEPHGIIFKLNRQPLSELSDEIVRRDQDYWMKLTAPMIGDWLMPGTAIEDVAAFAEKVFAKHDFSDFTGDPQFVRNDYSCKMFSKERNSIAGLYAWRAQHAANDAEKKRMNNAADFAFRQAWALCPDSMETVVRYVNLLLDGQRFSDALIVAQTAADMPSLKGPEGAQIRSLVEQIKNIQQRVK